MGAAEEFPTRGERAAATALLLLLQRPTTISKRPLPPLSLSSCFDATSSSASSASSSYLGFSCGEERSIGHDGVGEPSSCISDSCSSASDLNHRAWIGADPLRILGLAASCDAVKREIYQNSTKREEQQQRGVVARHGVRLGVKAEWDEDDAASSVSSASGSRVVGTGRLRVGVKGSQKLRSGRSASAQSGLKKRRRCWRWWARQARPRITPLTRRSTPSERRRAEAIIEFLAGRWAPELHIREALGDSPDTSKALRMLLRRKEVKRAGAGGPTDPFMYTVASRESSGVSSV